MSLAKEILFITARYYPLPYRALYDHLYKKRTIKEIEKKRTMVNLRNTLSRMGRNGLLANTKGVWSITPEGAEFLNGKNSDIKRFYPPKKNSRKKTTKSLIIIFDIPEKKRRYRDWLRSELIGFGFDQIQKSVWFGPQLPKDFVEYLGEIDLLTYIRFFRANEKDLV
jgi:DNA-binding transcriptional regulator PaaX